ncbi:MAG: hypothetical protein JWO33_183, partial [Caulobacteraceae bacterium]|nr:hypothetical protein [Caulobacteraceae bacterium]
MNRRQLLASLPMAGMAGAALAQPPATNAPAGRAAPRPPIP